MRRGIDDEVAQRAVEREPARPHLDRLERGLGDVEFLVPELGADRADQLVELDQLGRRLARFLAHQQDGAVGDPLQLVEIGEPPRPLLVVLDELGPEPHAGDRRAEIVAGGRDQPHAAFHRASSAAPRAVQRPAVALTSAGPRSGKIGRHAVGADLLDRISSRTSGRTMRFATNTAIAVAPNVISEAI